VFLWATVTEKEVRNQIKKEFKTL